MSIIFKKTIQAAGAKRLSCALMAVCMVITMFFSIGSIIPAIAAPSGKMLEVYNANSWADQTIANYYNSLPAGTYVLTANFKNEGRWLMQAQIDDNGAANPSNPWRQVPGNVKTESETEYVTTIKFTTTDTHNFRARFVAPNSTSKLWITNVTLCRENDSENLLTNGDFSNGTTGWTITNQTSTFANATIKDIEDGFFDKPTEIMPPSGKMLEVYDQNAWGGQNVERQTSVSLTPGTYKFSAYFKHEGGWSMQAKLYIDGAWRQVFDTVDESENEYYTTITFTVPKDAKFSAVFVSPNSKSKLWIANVSVYHITGGEYLGTCINYISNGDFSNGTTNWGFSNTTHAYPPFKNATTKDIENGFFDKATIIEPTGGKMLEVYNQNAWNDQSVANHYNPLPAGKYKLSAYFKHEGGWSMQAQINSGSGWNPVSDVTVTESENEYLTTIEFTLTSATNFRAIFKAPASTSKLWIANVTLCREGETENLLTNGDFSNGTTDWTITNKTTTFANATTKDIEDGFFDKVTIPEPTGSKMLEAYNKNAWNDQSIANHYNSLPAGTYVLTAHFKNEGRWLMQAQIDDNGAANPSNPWRQVPGNVKIESETEYVTTIKFTTTATHNFRARFVAPNSTSKLWIANVTLCCEGETENLLTNGDFSNGTTGWTITNQATTFANATTKNIEDGFFDKPTEIVPPSGNMLEVYDQNAWGGQNVERQTTVNLTPGTYEFSAYFKHEGGWTMQAKLYLDGKWVQVADTVTESENEYFTTIKFTVPKDAKFSAVFVSPKSKSKLWIANVSLYHITGGEYFGTCINYITNGDFSDGTKNWGFSNSSNATPPFANAQTKNISDGFFDIPEKKMVVLYNQNPSWSGQLYQNSVGTLPAGDYVCSVNFKHDGSWSFAVCYWDGSKWASIPGAQTVKSTDEYKITTSFTLTEAQSIMIRFFAPKNNSVAYIANATLHRTDIPSHTLVTNGYFANGFTPHWSGTGNSFDNAYLEKIPEDFFLRGALTPQMIHVKDTGGSGAGTIKQWLYLKTDKEYTLSYDINYIGEPKDVVGAAAYVNVQYPTSTGTQYYLPYYSEVSEDRYTKKYEIRVHDLAVTSGGEARMQIGLQFLPREAYIANIVLTEKGKTENLLDNSDFAYGFEGWDQGASCIELVPYDNSKFVREETKPLAEKYMLYSDGSKSYADFGQHLKLSRTNGSTVIQYEFQCRYRATDGNPGLRMAFHPVGATRYADAATNQGAFNLVTEYDEETGYWYGIFTVPEKAYIDKEGFAHIFLSVNTELSGAGYFTDFKLFDITNDENRTKNLLVNPDFKQGLWGWVGTDMWTVPELNFNTLKFTEAKQLFSLVPYDEKMFIKNDSEQYFNDGEWWIKYGEQREEDEEDISVITQIVKGKLDYSDGTPIVGAPLVLRSEQQVYETFTEMDGSFEFKDISVGKYSLYMVMEDGSELFIIEVNVNYGDVVTVSAAYDLETGSFDGTLTAVPNTEDTAQDTEKVTRPDTNIKEKDRNIFVLLLITLGSMVMIAVIIVVTIWLTKKYRAKCTQSK